MMEKKSLRGIVSLDSRLRGNDEGSVHVSMMEKKSLREFVSLDSRFRGNDGVCAFAVTMD